MNPANDHDHVHSRYMALWKDVAALEPGVDVSDLDHDDLRLMLAEAIATKPKGGDR
jgi:hypothetical protein